MTPANTDEETVASIRAGAPLDYSYDAYGAGRVNFVVSWDTSSATFTEQRTDRDMGGNVDVARRTITLEAAARHVRASRADG